MPHFDAIAIGGGPSGASAAIAMARAGLTVGIVERSDFTNDRFGETLPPHATPLLQELGVWEEFLRDAHLPSPGILSAWESEIPAANDFIFNPFGNGWHLDRTRFDRTLVRGAELAGATLLHSAHIEICERTTSGWRLAIRQGREIREWTTALLLDATGRSAWLARRQGARPASADRLVAAIGILEPSESVDHRTILEAAEDGWWYAARLPQGRFVAAFMTDRDLLPHGPDALRDFWQERIERTSLVHRSCAIGSAGLELKVRSACTMRLDRDCGAGWIAIGDAALAMDPLSSHGIWKALESGRRVAPTIIAMLSGVPDAEQTYSTWLNAEYANFLRSYAGHYDRVRRWPDSHFWNRRRSRFSNK